MHACPTGPCPILCLEGSLRLPRAAKKRHFFGRSSPLRCAISHSSFFAYHKQSQFILIMLIFLGALTWSRQVRASHRHIHMRHAVRVSVHADKTRHATVSETRTARPSSIAPPPKLLLSAVPPSSPTAVVEDVTAPCVTADQFTSAPHAITHEVRVGPRAGGPHAKRQRSESTPARACSAKAVGSLPHCYQRSGA